MSDGKFSVFTSSYVNTALNQSAFRNGKCYIIINRKAMLLLCNIIVTETIGRLLGDLTNRNSWFNVFLQVLFY